MPRRPRRSLPRLSRRHAALVLAVAPLLAPVASDLSAGVIVRNIKPAPGSTTTAQRPASAALTTSSDSPITAYSFTPPINGFQPFVVFGLTNENDNDLFSPKSAAPLSQMSGSVVVPNPARQFIATLDTGSSTTLIGYEDQEAINLFANGLEGPNTIDVIGTGGSEEVYVSDALGLYITGLGNATAGANGPVVAQSSLKGMWNTSILTTLEPTSIIPNLIGNPMAGHWQMVIRNSQTQRLTVNGKTYQGPQVTLNNIGTPHDNSFVEVTLTPMSPGGANSAPIFEPDFFGSQDWADDPMSPTVWNALMCNVSLKNADLEVPITRPFLFDTGAQVSVISTQTATDLGIDTGGGNPTPVDFTAEVLGIGGITTVNGYFIDNFNIVTNGVDLEATNVPVLVLDVDDPSDGQDAVAGIIGMNLFNDRDLIINAKTGTGSYLAMSEFAIPAKWNVATGGNWGDNSKWMRGVPWQPGEQANFTNAISAPQTINVDADYTLGRMTFDNANRYTVSGPGALRFEENVGRAGIQVNNGSHTVSTNVTLASDTDIAVIPAGSTLTMGGVISSTNFSGLIKMGQGTVEVKRLVDLGDVDVQAGKLKVLPPTAPGALARTSSVETVAIGAAARLDLTNNNLIIHDMTPGSWSGSNYTGVQGLVRKGRNGGTWDGAGGIITSTSAAASSLTSLGVASASKVLNIAVDASAMWAGQTVYGASTLVLYTYAGDANLDGFISGDDYTAIDFNIAIPGASGWVNGDFNYDGIISGDDYSMIDFNIVAQGAAFPTAGGVKGVAAVPEPAGVALMLLSVAPLARRKRRSRSA